MDEQQVKRLEAQAYYAVVRALAASNKLNFDTEALLLDLQGALGLDDETCINMVSQSENDEEVVTLKAYDTSAPKAMPSQPINIPSMTAQKPAVARGGAGPSYAQDTPFSQPAKKQKKSTGGSLPPPAGISRTPSASPAVKSAPSSAKQPKARSVPNTPQGAAVGGLSHLAPQRSKPPPRPTISHANYSRVMQRNQPEEIEAYLAELNAREREIFTQLISSGVDENDPSLNDVHKELIRWFKLDERQSQLSQQMAVAD